MSSPPVAPAPRWPLILLRATATALAVLAVVQSALAGSFLNGHYESLALHAAGGTAMAVVAFAQAVAGLLVRWIGRGPLWPFGVPVLLTAATAVQIALGYHRAVGLHVLFGVLLVSATLFAAVGAWRLRLPVGRSARDGAPGADGGGLLPRPGGPMEVAQ
ncbi:hypothetical protein [Kitasatospora sp. A2-31]|uniref:hypothetical protein n=1 Tax=Kitasatospora sp. A2-31 TaxID=2916414 RepID=UPI001EEA1B72|nr:hypothetical protein [Kitasatospora sp. A2-31]MCG6495769.1 hypothetical protein [Kitasatospora sp. A2-31]